MYGKQDFGHFIFESRRIEDLLDREWYAFPLDRSYLLASCNSQVTPD